jgi:ABC-type multidrug transport system fused ATPase/permease subunit
MAFLFLVGKLVDAAQGKEDFFLKGIDQIALAMLILLLSTSLVSFTRTLLVAKVSERSIADIRKELYQRIIALPMTFFEENRVGDLTSRITTDVTQLQEMVSWTLIELLRQVLILFVGIGIILWLTPKLALVMIASFPITIIIALVLGRLVKKLSRKTQDAVAEANTVAEETFQAIQAVKAYTNEWLEAGRYRKSIDLSVDHALKAAWYRAGLIFFIIAGIFGGILLVLWFGAKMIESGQLSPGELTTFALLTAFIGGAVGTLGDLYARLQRTVGASERIIEILDEKEEILLDETVPALELDGSVAFDRVAFHYPTRKDVGVLKNISFNMAPGKRFALVGPSGAGKSTIIRLLMRYFDPVSGEIMVDGKAIQGYDIRAYRRQIGIVPQEVILFGGSIKENIAYGNPKASEVEIIDAAKQANAWEFMERFPEGRETMVGERGVQLSGGQKQRVAIARAILKDPTILILDEATSSLDSESEKLVQEALDGLMQNRTTIMIAHRLSTVRQADQILVIQDGVIIESGTHEALSQSEGLYQNLLELQFSA